jgi:hypothetical protein
MTRKYLVLMLTLALTTPVIASADYKGMDGKSLLLTCQGAEKSRSLAVMCHNYLNGYLDAVHHLNPHPEGQKQAAAKAVDRALKDLFPRKGGK